MKKRAFLFFLSIIFLFAPCSNLHALSKKGTIIRGYLKKANAFYNNNRPFDAINTLRDAVKADINHPLIHVQLSILYYGLGLLDEAIAESELAVELDPGSEKNRFDLAKFYLIDKQLTEAENQFSIILTHNPGFTLGYYYLGLTYYRQKKYDLALLCLQRAKLLGHRGTVLEEKIENLSTLPKRQYPASGDRDRLFRFILVPTKQEAESILADIQKGKLFDVALIEKKNKKKQVDSGLIMLSELKASIAKSVKNLQPFSKPTIIFTDPDYRIIQRIAPFNIEQWKRIATSGSLSTSVTISPLERKKDKTDLLVKTMGQASSSRAKTTTHKDSQPIKSPEKEIVFDASPPKKRAPQVAASKPFKLPPVDIAAIRQDINLRAKETTKTSPDPDKALVKEKPSLAAKATQARLQQEAKKIEKLKVLDIILKWRNAWQAKDVKGYLSMYSKRFKPQKRMSLKTWKKKRRRSLSRPKFIIVGIENLVVDMKSDTRAVATFVQEYTSDRYADMVKKTLVLVKEGTNWKISRETSK